MKSPTLCLEEISQFKHLYFDLSLPIMLKYLLIWLSLPMLQAVEVGRVRLALIAGSQVGKVALDVARCATTTRGAETDIRRHLTYDMVYEVVGVCCGTELSLRKDVVGDVMRRRSSSDRAGYQKVPSR